MTAKKGELDNIFQLVMSRFEYTADLREHWASSDELDDETLRDDCDGFALACRKICREMGIESRLVYCKTETGGGHLVLEHEGWILDNRQDRVKSRSMLPYTWISMSGYNKGDPWHKITG